MSIGGFLKDRWIFCMTQGLVVLFVANFLQAFGLNDYGIGFVCMTIVLLDGALLVGEYIQRRLYYNQFLKLFERLDKKQLISELLEEPSFEEGKIWWEVLRGATKAMNDEVAKYRLLQEEYKAYIEAWIHEIKTPIACMRLMCENYKSEVTKNIEIEVGKVDSFVEQALFYARSTSVEKDYVIHEVSLMEMVKGAVKKQARTIIENKVQIDWGEGDAKVLADPKWVDFILGQLISNSLKYKKEKLVLTWEIVCHESKVILSLRDNGIGIPKKDSNRVWDKGFTGENGRIYGKSTGIGLYLCKKLCKKMHLGINLESKEGEGTMVSLAFPKDKRIFFEDEMK